MSHQSHHPKRSTYLPGAFLVVYVSNQRTWSTWGPSAVHETDGLPPMVFRMKGVQAPLADPTSAFSLCSILAYSLRRMFSAIAWEMGDASTQGHPKDPYQRQNSSQCKFREIDIWRKDEKSARGLKKWLKPAASGCIYTWRALSHLLFAVHTGVAFKYLI